MVTTPSDFDRLFPGTGGALYGPASHGWMASFRRTGARSRLPGLYLAGGSTHPGPGVPMAAISGRLAAQALITDLASTSTVPPGGYAWWYVDALSDDGRLRPHDHRLHRQRVLAVLRLRAPARHGDPYHHCALNVALYGEGKRWAMTERGRSSLYRSRSSLIIGPSLLAWDGDALTIHIDEITAPIPSSLRGVVRIYPKALTSRSFTLDPAGRHLWWPIAPSAHVQVAMEQPEMRWQGTGYLDTNAGDEPIEDAFQSWHWSRADCAPAPASSTM